MSTSRDLLDGPLRFAGSKWTPAGNGNLTGPPSPARAGTAARAPGAAAARHRRWSAFSFDGN